MNLTDVAKMIDLAAAAERLHPESLAEAMKKPWPSKTLPLSFAELRMANIRRLPLFRNRKGEICHRADGSDWCLAQWSNAMTGEVGEAANIIKKVDRGDVTLEEARSELAKELADVQTYLDILAFRAGIDLAEATRSKFNEVSDRIGCDVKLCV